MCTRFAQPTQIFHREELEQIREMDAVATLFRRKAIRKEAVAARDKAIRKFGVTPPSTRKK